MIYHAPTYCSTVASFSGLVGSIFNYGFVRSLVRIPRAACRDDAAWQVTGPSVRGGAISTAAKGALSLACKLQLWFREVVGSDPESCLSGRCRMAGHRSLCPRWCDQHSSQGSLITPCKLHLQRVYIGDGVKI